MEVEYGNEKEIVETIIYLTKKLIEFNLSDRKNHRISGKRSSFIRKIKLAVYFN